MQSENSNKSILFFRWIIGGFLGAVIGLRLWLFAESEYPPVLGPIISGQQEIFYISMFHLFYPSINSDEIFNLSIFLYQIVWGIVGALIVSGRKTQKNLGLILLILYSIIGGCFSAVWGMLSMAT